MRATHTPPTPNPAADIRRAVERALGGLPPEGVTIAASDEATMREELLGIFVDDAEHRGHAA